MRRLTAIVLVLLCSLAPPGASAQVAGRQFDHLPARRVMQAQHPRDQQRGVQVQRGAEGQQARLARHRRGRFADEALQVRDPEQRPAQVDQAAMARRNSHWRRSAGVVGASSSQRGTCSPLS